MRYQRVQRLENSVEQYSSNTVYERFFQGFAVKTADVLGIVYTPQEIVDFMGAAVEEVLVQDFGLSLADPAVHIIDPCTGTGNFVVNLLKRLDERHKPALRDVYQHRLFANEVALMPYYIASLNIEHAFRELTGEYLPFEGLCLVDTLGMSESEGMLPMFAEENTERIQRQQAAPITVIIGNPPYNVGQQNENDNNKNRKYARGDFSVDKRIVQTYVKESNATLLTKVYDHYVRFWRWATDRLNGEDGIVAFVTNNSFVDQIAFDGMRKQLLKDFTHVYHVDLHGNVRQNPKLSGTTHNVFGIQVGVGITVAVRSSKHAERKLFYHRVPEFWTASEKLAWLGDHVERAGRQNALNTVEWTELEPDKRGNWIKAENAEEFSSYLPLGSKQAKTSKSMEDPKTVFKLYTLGVITARDSHVYDFDQANLLKRAETFVDIYNSAVDKARRLHSNFSVQELIDINDQRIKWSRQTKNLLTRGTYSNFQPNLIRKTLYRPFTRKHIYFDDFWNEEQYQNRLVFPTALTSNDNCAICLPAPGARANFWTLATNTVASYSLTSLDATQCFPFYVYAEDGSNRRENITDWALRQFQSHYNDPTISKWDIFYYTYAVLHHPDYRTRFKDALKKELPRIPFAPDFRAFASAGQALAALHLDYEAADPYPLTDHWTPGKPADYRVTKMRWLNKPTALSPDTRRGMIHHALDSQSEPADSSLSPFPSPLSTSLIVNPSLTLSGFPPEAFDYKLGGRSALDWVVEQYQVKTDKRSGITSDPNRYADDERYIVDLVRRVTTVSVETVKLVDSLPPLFAAPPM